MSSSRLPRSRPPAVAAVLLGGLAVLAIPAAVLATRLPNTLTLLRALYVGVPAAGVLGAVAWICARRARLAAARSLSPDRSGPVRLGRFLAFAGVYLAVTGTLALAFYGVLRSAQ